ARGWHCRLVLDRVACRLRSAARTDVSLRRLPHRIFPDQTTCRYNAAGTGLSRPRSSGERPRLNLHPGPGTRLPRVVHCFDLAYQPPEVIFVRKVFILLFISLAAFIAPVARAQQPAPLPKLATAVAFPNLRFDRPVAMDYPKDGSNLLFVNE